MKTKLLKISSGVLVIAAMIFGCRKIDDPTTQNSNTQLLKGGNHAPCAPYDFNMNVYDNSTNLNPQNNFAVAVRTILCDPTANLTTFTTNGAGLIQAYANATGSTGGPSCSMWAFTTPGTYYLVPAGTGTFDKVLRITFDSSYSYTCAPTVQYFTGNKSWSVSGGCHYTFTTPNRGGLC